MALISVNTDVAPNILRHPETREHVTSDVQGKPRLFGTRIPAIVVPTLITSASAACGLIAINMAIHSQFEVAVLFVLCAGLFDCMDGQAARMLGCTSRFGMELDSLVDFLSFGVAPGFIVYLWVLNHAPTAGFMVATIYVLCCAYRLARFNVSAAKPKSERPNEGAYFEGIPAPAAAACALLPLMVSFASGSGWANGWLFGAAIVTGTALMMVSTVPTYSSKSIFAHVDMAKVLPVIMIVAAGLYYATWATLVMVMVLYIALLPVPGLKRRTQHFTL